MYQLVSLGVVDEERMAKSQRTSAEKDSRGYASIALMVSLLFGCMAKKPPETAVERRHKQTTCQRTFCIYKCSHVQRSTTHQSTSCCRCSR
jgi:hypothetical protein